MKNKVLQRSRKSEEKADGLLLFCCAKRLKASRKECNIVIDDTFLCNPEVLRETLKKLYRRYSD
jgi:hypothetical protein